MAALRILVIGINYSPEMTGIAPYTTGMSESLAHQGQVQVLTTYPHYPNWRRHTADAPWRTNQVIKGVRVSRLKHYIPRNPTGLSRLVSEATFSARVLFARTTRPDIVVAVTPGLLPTAAATLLSWRWRVPLGIVVQDLYGRAVQELNLLGGRTQKLVSWLENAIFARAAGIVAIHRTMAETMVRDYEVDEHSITVIRNWSHVSNSRSAPEAVREHYGWGSTKVVLHAGNMGAKQGLDLVVEAAQIAQDEELPIRFVLMGGGSRRSYLERLAGGLDTLFMLEAVPQEEFTSVLGAADFLLLSEAPGLAEMCVPSKLTSYFSAGRPVIASTSGKSAAAQEIRASDAGVLIEPGDPRALVDLVMGVDEANSRRMGEQGRKYASAHLSQDAAFRAYGRWVDSLLKNKRTDHR